MEVVKFFLTQFDRWRLRKLIIDDSDFLKDRFWFNTPGAFERKIMESLSAKSEYMYIVKVCLDDWREIWDIRKYVADNDEVLKSKLEEIFFDYEIIVKFTIDDTIRRIR